MPTASPQGLDLDKMSYPQLKAHRTAVESAMAARQAEIRNELAKRAEAADLRVAGLAVAKTSPPVKANTNGNGQSHASAAPAVKQGRPDVAARNRLRAKTRKPATQQPKPTYRNPDNAKQVWSGRGPRPRWLREKIAGGGTLEQFKAT